MKEKSPWGAAILNLVIPGAGYWYVGTKRPILSIGLTLGTLGTYLSPAYWGVAYDPPLIIGALIFALALTIDAYRDAQAVNESLSASST